MSKFNFSAAFRAMGLCAAAVFVTGCASTEIDVLKWRAEQSIARPVQQRGALSVELDQLERTRNADELAAARQLALALVAENPNDPRVQYVASRAESDGLFLFDEADKHSRNHAAMSARHYASHAFTLGASGGAMRAQLAWTLGTTTHLQPMFDRAEHAELTIRTAQTALQETPDEPTALATLAIVHLRLETLPWIASVMAVGAPDSSLEEAEKFARGAVARVPSREHRLILAKVLVAADKEDEAKRELEAALASDQRFPRDAALEPSVRKLLTELSD